MYSWGLRIILHFWHQPEADGVPVSVEGLEVLLVVDPLFASCTNGQATASCKTQETIYLQSGATWRSPLFVFNLHSTCKSLFRKQATSHDVYHTENGPYVLFMQIMLAGSRQKIKENANEPWCQIPSTSCHGDEWMSPSHVHTRQIKRRIKVSKWKIAPFSNPILLLIIGCVLHPVSWGIRPEWFTWIDLSQT